MKSRPPASFSKTKCLRNILLIFFGLTDPFSPSASELIDLEFQELITSTITTDSLVHNVIALILILCGFKIYKDCILCFSTVDIKQRSTILISDRSSME